MPALPKNVFSFGRHINNNIKTVVQWTITGPANWGWGHRRIVLLTSSINFNTALIGQVSNKF